MSVFLELHDTQRMTNVLLQHGLPQCT